MNRKVIACTTATAILLSTLSGCENINKLINQTAKQNIEPVTQDSPYYYVTNGSIIKERNSYMELEVKIPKIEYSNEENDPIFDSVNEEIESSITTVIEECKENAYETYQKYLETAKTNVKNDKEKALDKLKIKYKSIITDDEVKAISAVASEGIISFASNSDIILDPFNATEDIVNQGPHNKKIIVIDNSTTTSEGLIVTGADFDKPEPPVSFDTSNIETPDELIDSSLQSKKITINGRPGNQKPMGDISQFDKKTMPKKATTSSIKDTPKSSIASKATSSTIKEFPKDKIPRQGNINPFDKGLKPGFGKMNRSTESDTEYKEITKENFYKELSNIRRMRVPNQRSLTMQYIPTYIYCDFDVKCLDEDYISIYIQIYETRTQDITKVLFYNIDLKQKKIINIKDLLGENFKDTCVTSINKSIENLSEDKKALLTTGYSIDNYINDETPFFINNNHIPVVVFDKCSITAGAVGYPEFQIIK